jgi:hypothetical protein
MGADLLMTEQQQSYDKRSSYYEPSNLESDRSLPKNNSSNTVSSCYNSYNTNSIRSDYNDIYSINRKLMTQSKYEFNSKNSSSLSLHQMFSRNATGSYTGRFF